MRKYKSYNEKIIKIINETQYHFNEWLNGNFEDDPLPYEINTILFLFSIKNNLISLNMSGGEYLQEINQPLMYCPLEIQFFNYRPFFNLLNYKIYFTNKTYRFNKKSKMIFIRNIIVSLIKRYLSNNTSSLLKNKNIYVGELYKYSKECIKIEN